MVSRTSSIIVSSRVGSAPTSSFTRRVAIATLGGGRSLCSRYTIAKFRDFHKHTKTTSGWRCLAVLVLTPLPSLVTSLLPNLIPLQPPELGVLKNWGFILHFIGTVGLVIFGSVFQIRGPSKISRSELSNLDAVLISGVGAGMLVVGATLISYWWRFPIPFIWVVAYPPYCGCLIWVVAYPPYCGCLALAHVVVLRGKLWSDSSTIRQSIAAFVPVYIVQSLQVVAYSSFSVVFELVSEWEQIGLLLLFPLMKHAFRYASHRLVRHLTEDGEEVAVSGVEICAAMYQSLVMQNTPSVYTTAALIVVDIVQGLLTIHLFMDKQGPVPRADLIHQASEFVETEASSISDADLAPFASRRQTPMAKSIRRLRIFTRAVGPISSIVPSSPSSHSARVISKKWSLTQALELTQAAESTLLTEYFEISLPLVNAVFFLIASQLDTAIYNPKLQPYYADQGLLLPATVSLTVYALLQAISLVLMQVVMWYRYRISALSLLAFVLERNAWSIQGKLITWLVMFFQFSVVHYGVDFTFKFEFKISA